MKALEAALYSKLSADGTLVGKVPGGIHNTVARPGAAYPHLIFQKVSGDDDYTWSRRIRTSYLYQVRVIDRGATPDKEPLMEALDRVDALLTDGTLTITGATAIYSRRVGDMPDMPQADSGIVYLQVGATWRIEVT